MDLLIIEKAIVGIATAIAAYTDYKTGYIYDWITIPLVVIGAILRIWQQDWIGLGLGIGVFVFLYALYYTGKLGGGDVKLFSGITLVIPTLEGQFFLFNVLFFAAASALGFYSLYYLFRIWKEKIKIDWKENHDQVRMAFLLGVFSVTFLGLMIFTHALSLYVGIAILALFLLACIYIGVEHTVKKNFFLEHVGLEKLEEDEIIATEFLTKEQLEKSGLNLKKIVGETEKQKLEKLGITKVPVYRNAPRFGPFIFVGTLIALAVPEFFSILFFSF